jgi:hypothetical protein
MRHRRRVTAQAVNMARENPMFISSLPLLFSSGTLVIVDPIGCFPFAERYLTTVDMPLTKY